MCIRDRKTADVTFQNLDSAEISLTDVSHYFDSDPTKVVEGLRKDGKKPSSMMADTTTANAQVRSLSETVRLDARTKLLNPKFYEGMLASGYEGTREITKRLRNTMGWSATAGAVDNFVYEDANEVRSRSTQHQSTLRRRRPPHAARPAAHRAAAAAAPSPPGVTADQCDDVFNSQTWGKARGSVLTPLKKAAAPATTGDAIAQSGLQKKELATFCL